MGAEPRWACLVVRSRRPGEGPEALAAQARLLGVAGVRAIGRASLVFVRGDLDDADRARLSGGLLADPLLQDAVWERPAVAPGTVVVETVLHPGVTDPVATAVHRGARLAGVSGLHAVATGTRYEIAGDLADGDLDLLIARLLANPVVEHAAIGTIEPAPDHDGTAPAVEHVPVRELDDDALVALSRQRGLALDPAELVAVRAHFREVGREPTDVELETIAQTWSEHCAHKTFRANVTWREDGAPIEPLLRQLRRATEAIAAPWVRSAFVDNAGIVAFDDDVELSIKAETHNHPSAIEPFGGANTGVGGVLRDVLGVSAKPIAVTDVLCFGMPDADPAALPAGVLHPRRIRDGVIAGVADYGNKLGVPTVAGAIVHDPGYTANPLVFCGCVGVAPLGSHRTEPQVGDRVIVIGGRTGRDGIRGATFSSMEMDATTGEVAGASVQIGDPIVEKGVLDVLLAARDAGLYHAVTDCGAGGLSSAVGEMAATLGADVSLDAVPRKYPGLAPWEAWLSEAQERMVFAVAPPDVAALERLCERYEVELADLGAFTGDKRLVVRDGGVAVLDLDVVFLHDGRPTRQLVAARPAPPAHVAFDRATIEPEHALLALLGHPSLRSQQDVVHGYDHEVLGRTAVRPFVGACDDGPSDAAVIVPPGSTSGALAALGIGVNARFGVLDARAMAWSVIDEAIRNVVATGADPDRVVLLDNFSWGDPRRPETMGQLVDAVTGCCEAALAHRAPFVSGKDSLNNEYATTTGERLAIPPTLVIHALGRVPTRAGVVTSDLKAAGNRLYLVGRTRDELGGSHLDLVLGAAHAAGTVPAPDLDAPARYRLVHAAMQAGLVRSCHDLAEGGLAVAATEMAIGGRLGVRLDVAPVASATGAAGAVAALFAESNGRLLVEVADDDAAAFEALLGTEAAFTGSVSSDDRIVLAVGGATVIDVTIGEALAAWAGHLPEAPADRLAGSVAPSNVNADPPTAAAGASAAEPSSTADERRPPAAAALVRSDVRAVVLAAPGTNRDHDVAEALELAGATAEIVPLAALRAAPALLDRAGLVVVAGGFSFADSLGSGALFALELAEILRDAVGVLTASGRPVLGICNGFQVLVRLGLLPGGGRRAGLDHNAAGRFECRPVTLDVPASRSVWTAGLDEPIVCPVAHGEGRFVADDDTMAALAAGGQIALRYADGATLAPAGGAYPANPNGSYADVAGVCDPTGLVLGLMPHPENHVHDWQHPRWRRGDTRGSGLDLFRNGVHHAAGR